MPLVIVETSAPRRGPGASAVDERLQHLRELLTFVRQHVPYFRERQEYAVEPERFHQLPLMRKAELRVHFPEGLVSDQVAGAQALEEGWLATQTEADALLVQVIPALGATVPEALLMEALGDALGVSKVRVQKVGRLEPESSLKFRLTGSRVVQTPELLA